MKPETLEKLLAYIDLVKYGPFAPRAKARDELRALVKAESDSAMAEKAMSDYREGRALDKIYEPEGGDARMPSRPLDGKLNPPSDVQAEGRGEIEILTSAIESALNLMNCPHLESVYLGKEKLRPSIIDGFQLAESKLRLALDKIALERFRKESHTPHNPDNLQSPGEGYRFLDEDEILRTGESIEEIERWFEGEWSAHWAGTLSYSTYRTRLTREQLAKKRKEAGR